MPINRSTATMQQGVALGPGKLSVPELTGDRLTARYDMGEKKADAALNGDGLHLSAEAKLRAHGRGQESLERLRLNVGAEGVIAKIRLAKDGEADLGFDGLSLKDGYFKDRLEAGKDWLEDRPVAAGAAVVGVLAAGHAVAKAHGPIGFDTGGIELYEKHGFSAEVEGDLELTGDSRFIRPTGAKGRLAYESRSVGRMALEAGYDVDKGPRAGASWAKRFDNGVEAHASASWNRQETQAFVGVSYRW